MAVRWRALARARLLRRSGRTDEAIALIDANLAEMPGKADWRRKSALLNERALAEIQVGQGAAARDSLIAASNVLVEAGRDSTILYATVIDNLGFVERETGDLARASECHEKAIAVCEKIGAPHHLARSLINAAIVWKDRGLLGKARAHLERAKGIVPPSDLRLYGHLYAASAVLSQLKQEFEEARRQHLIALIAYRRAGDRENEALELHNLALVEHLRDRAAVGTRFLRKSMLLNNRLGLAPGVASDLRYLGLFTFDAGKRDEGLRLLRQAWHALADVDDFEGMLWCELDLARIGTAGGAYESARDLLNGTIRRAEAIGDPLLEYNLFVARGKVYEQLGERGLAAREYETAIVRAESLRAGIRDEEDALGFFRFAQLDAFDALIELSVEQGDASTAWRCCQAAKTRELQRRLRFDSGISPRGVSGSAIARERSLTASHRKLMAEWRAGHRAEVLPGIEAIELELTDLWAEIGTVDPEYASLRRGEAISYGALRELLAVGTRPSPGSS